MGTPTAIKIRTMTAADITEVLAIETQSFKDSTWTREFFQSCLQSSRHAKLVAELGGKILAYAILEVVGGNVYLLKFAVAPEFRRRTLGKNFMGALLQLAPKWGGVQMLLHVNTKNVAAIRLYETCGFRVLNRLENFYKKTGENAFTMERKI